MTVTVRNRTAIVLDTGLISTEKSTPPTATGGVIANNSLGQRSWKFNLYYCPDDLRFCIFSRRENTTTVVEVQDGDNQVYIQHEGYTTGFNPVCIYGTCNSSTYSQNVQVIRSSEEYTGE